ncbi:MAG: DnaD domain protein [Chloroflexota bacterium]
MQKFDGFPDDSKLSPTAFPAQFYSELLPMIDDLAELKLTIFCFWALHQREGSSRYLLRDDFYDDDALVAGLLAIDPAATMDQVLTAALNRAMERGTLICAEVELDNGSENLYFMNSKKGRSAIAQIRAGEWQPGDENHPVEILPERPNIYKLYEANVGALTPMVAEYLKDAEKDYPLDWIEDAIRGAVVNNKRNWSYIQAILRRRESEGKRGGSIKRSPEQDGQSYITGEYADFIEH